MKEAKNPSKTLTRVTAGILTVVFLGFIFTAFVAMLVNSHADLLESVRMTPELRAKLPKRHTPLDSFAARINSFTSKIAEVMWLKDEMGYANSAFQYALGKKVINTGKQNMIRLNDGHLYDLQAYKSLERNAEDIVKLRQTTLKDLPFLFVYEHPTLYDPENLPSEYAALDHSAQMADEALACLRKNGIRTLDSRDVLPNCGRDMDDLLMVTDQHWSTLAAITMAQHIAVEINDMTGAKLDPTRLDLENLNTLTHEKLFLGKYGQRIGVSRVEPDDIVEYWPKYETNITRDYKRASTVGHGEGSFREAVTRADRLDPEPGKTWNTYAYTYYGQVEVYDLLANPDAPDFTVMVLKDSYSAPICTFMSLMARQMVCIDLRQNSQSLEEWIEQYHPDVVVMAYSLQMLRDDEYEFG